MSEPQKHDPSASSTLQSTRQLLDELDALMEKMLALPTDETDLDPPETESADEPTGEPAGDRPWPGGDDGNGPPAFHLVPRAADDHAAAGAPSAPAVKGFTGLGSLYTYEEGPESRPEETPPPEQPPGEEPAASGEGAAQPPAAPDGPSPLLPRDFLGQPSKAPEIKSGSLLNQSRMLNPTSVRWRYWYLWPLTAVNGVFDGLTHLLGPWGEQLRSPKGKAVLGWVGVACLVLAAALQIFFWGGWN